MQWWAAALVLAACGDDSAAPIPDANSNHLGADASTDAPSIDAARTDALPANILFEGSNSHPVDLAVDSDYVYWTDDYPPGRLMRTAKADATTQTLFDQQGGQVGQIALDDTNVYWTGSMGLQAAPKTGGIQPTVLHASAGG